MSALRRTAVAILLLGAALLASQAPAAAANALSAFNEAVAGAMRHYRFAGHYLQTGNAALAGIEIESLHGKWRALAARFGAEPPDAFADDRGFADALNSIGARVATALRALDAGNAADAAKAIAPVGATVAALRQRNGIRVFADCIGDMNRAFEAVWKYRGTPPDFADVAQTDAARAAIAVVGYWYRRCQERAPARLAEAPGFVRLMEGASASTRRLWRAMRERDRLLLINTLRELRAFDRLIYLKFG